MKETLDRIKKEPERAKEILREAVNGNPLGLKVEE